MLKSHRILVVAISAALTLAVTAAPAAAHRGKGWGKKATGTIASFDGTTLTVTTTEGETVTATFTEETRVKVEHRGHHDRSGNPSNGDATHLTAGSYVLKMKVAEDGTLEKIRVRSAAPHEDHATGEADDDEAEEAEDTDEDETDETETDDDSDDSDDDETSTDTTDTN